MVRIILEGRFGLGLVRAVLPHRDVMRDTQWWNIESRNNWAGIHGNLHEPLVLVVRACAKCSITKLSPSARIVTAGLPATLYARPGWALPL
jgi:hypothetical protein